MSFLKELRRIRHQFQSVTGESRRSKQRQLEELVSRGLPVELREGLDFLVTGKTDAVTGRELELGAKFLVGRDSGRWLRAIK